MARQPGSISSAKTTRPRSSALFRRERLFCELDWNRRFACTWIAGPPGSGKTALVASFVNARSLTCLWYQVDAGDSDPAAFFAHLRAGAKSRLGATLKDLPSFTPDAAFSVSSFARLFFRELFAAVPTLTLALDDYHEAGMDCPLHDIVRVAIEQTPASAHITVTSRTRPPPTLARCQANGTVRSISWEQLSLTPEEVIGIASVHGIALDRKAANEWHERCGAWAAGLRLLLRSNTALQPRIDHAESPALMFDYLGQEVFRGLPAELQPLLLRLAFLPRIPGELVNELVGSPTAEHQLAALAEENLFTTVTRDGPPTYRFHPLFQDFLIDRAKRELPADEVLAGRHRAAAALQACGLVDEAAQMLIDAQSWDRLAQLVLAQAPQLMAQGRQRTVDLWLTQLPAAQLEDPWLLYWLGASRSLHDPFSGRASLEAAFDVFAVRQDRVGVLLAWSGVVDCIFHIYADLKQLDSWIARLEGLLAVDASFPSAEIEARVTFSMFVVLSFRKPQHPGLPMWRQRLDAIATVVPDQMFRLLSRLHLTIDQILQGNLHGAGVELEKLRHETANLPMSPFMELSLCIAQSTYAIYTGDVPMCFDEIDRALATAESSGIHIWDKVLLGQGAAIALSHGDIDRGRAFAQRRAAIVKPSDYEELGLRHLNEAWSCWLSGKPAEALAHVRLSTRFAERMGLPHFRAIDFLSASIVSFECGEQADGLSQVGAGRALGVLTRNPMLVWMADLLEAYMRLRRGEEATGLIESSMTAGNKHGYRHFFFWPRKAVALVCFKALDLGIQPDYANELIDKGQLSPPPEAMQSDRWPWPVKVSTLGKFSVLVHGVPIAFKGKTQHAPLNLLKALIALGGHVAESKVIDALWPDSDGDAGEQTLATTLFRLRKLVGVRAIKRQDGHMSISATECWVDCWALERLLNSAVEDANSLVERVRRLYAGPFLSGEDDALWALRLRERLHVALVKKMSVAAADALAHDRIELAHGIYDAGLEIDDLVEEFYRGQIQCHIAGDQASLAVSTYRRCQRILSNWLGVEPSPATTRLYLAAIHKSDG